MIYFLVSVGTDSGTYHCVARASNYGYAELKAMEFYTNEGMECFHAEAEMFNTFSHGDITNYDIVE